MTVLAGFLSSCQTPPATTKAVEGYPVYKFLNFGDINGRRPLNVVQSNGDEVVIYIKKSDLDELWETNPHDLYKQGKSHYVKIGYAKMESDEGGYNWATSFQAELVDHTPILRK